MTGILEPLPEQIVINSPTINQIGWIALAAFSLYVLSAYGSALRNRVKARLHIVWKRMREDVRILVGSTAAAIGIVIAVVNPVNLGAAFAGLTGWLAPIWMALTSLVMSVTNILGITDFGIEQVVTFAVIVGAVAIVLRKTGFMEDLAVWVGDVTEDDD